MFLGRALPSARSLFALLAVAVGAVVYACFDSQLEVTGLSAYRWAFTYYCLICFEMTCVAAKRDHITHIYIYHPTHFIKLGCPYVNNC